MRGTAARVSCCPPVVYYLFISSYTRPSFSFSSFQISNAEKRMGML